MTNMLNWWLQHVELKQTLRVIHIHSRQLLFTVTEGVSRSFKLKSKIRSAQGSVFTAVYLGRTPCYGIVVLWVVLEILTT